MNVVDEGHRMISGSSESKARAAPWRGGRLSRNNYDKTTSTPQASSKGHTKAPVAGDVMAGLLNLCRALLVVEGQASTVNYDASPRLLFNPLTRRTNAPICTI